MTISTLLSLQHTGAIALNGESSNAGHLTDLTGYFQTTLQQQIVAFDVDANAGAEVVTQTLNGSLVELIPGNGEELPVLGTELPIEQAALASVSASFSGQIGSGRQDLNSAQNAGLFSGAEIERARQYFGNQTSAPNVSLDTNSFATSITVPERSVPVQYSEFHSNLANTPEVQTALKLAERNGVLFESSLKIPATESALNHRQASQVDKAVVSNPVNEPLNNRALLGEIASNSNNHLPAHTILARSQAAATSAEPTDKLQANNLAVSSAVKNTISLVRNTIVQNSEVNLSVTSLNAGDASLQGVNSGAQLLPSQKDSIEVLDARSRQPGTTLAPPLRENPNGVPGLSEPRASEKSVEAIQYATSAQPGVQGLTSNLLAKGETDTFDPFREKSAELNNTKLNTPNQAGQSSAIRLNGVDMSTSVPDAVSLLNRQALNAETFRNTIKNAIERGIGRQQDTAIRADHNSTGDTRPIDGDSGRTIALPSVSSSQALNGLTTAASPALGGQVVDMAAGQAEAAAKLGQRIQWMLGSNARRAEIQIDPPELGSVQIQVSQEDRQTTVSFVTQNATARELIEQSLPRLREHLESLGIELADANVEQQSAGHTEGDDGKPDALANAASNEASDQDQDQAMNKSSEQADNERDGGIDAYA